MQLLDSWTLHHGQKKRRIELLQGDLAQLPPEHAVDILAVSAFPDDYLPTPTSLIGALSRNGISVAQLAASKELDMRQEFGCWLSQPLRVAAFRQLLCIESGWRGAPPEIVDDFFRALAPLFITTFPEGSVALPILGTGDQGYSAGDMLQSLLVAAQSWIARGLGISVMKIVAFGQRNGDLARERFADVRRQSEEGRPTLASHPREAVRSPESTDAGGPSTSFDLFVSYSHKDTAQAETLVSLVKKRLPDSRIFFDRSLQPGASWLMEIAESLDGARRVAALFTPNYWSSSYCKDEFAAALARQRDTNQSILFPIYYRTASIPYLFRNLEYADCREGDEPKLGGACEELCQSLS